jgi:hypothetical protein
MAELTFSSPIFTQSAEEMAAERAILNRDGIYDPNFEMLTSDARERYLSGAVQSGMGSAIYQTVEGIYDWFSGETKDPLNFSSINEVGPGSPVTYAMGNNKEGLQKDLDTIPAKNWQYVLSASSYNEYQDRLEFVRRGMPQAQASTIGLATGLVADIGVMALGGYLAEPIALAGLGTRTTMAGKVASRSFGSYGAQPVAAAAAEAANAVSRLSLGARYTAVGVGEEVVYQFARQGLDPLYDPSFGEVVQNMVISGSAAGLIGGVAFGRRFVADQIEEAAQGFYRQGQAILPGGFEINYTPFAFQSAAYADQVLASAGGRTADEALQEGAESATKEWNGLPQALPSLDGAQAAAFEVSLATGVQPTVDTFKAIGRAMVTAARTSRGGGFAFNKRFWEALSDELGEEVASKFRPLQQRSVINGADRRFDAVYEREFLVDDVWSLFNTGRWRSVQDAPNSLVFRVLDEIRSRGGTVTRQVVNEVVNDLRELAKNPPTRTNAKGRVVVDTYGRKAAVIEIINKRTGAVEVGSASTVARRKGRTTKPIDLPESVLKRLSATTTSKAVRAAAVAGGPDTGGSPPTITSTPGTFDGVPKKLSTWFTERIPLISPLLNQAARAMESENGAVRLIASLAFNARRATGAATKYTIFEAGSQILHSTMFTFMRGYRNSFVRFAMGRGTEDIAEDAGTLLDNWKYAFGNKDLRLQFNRRIMKQMRSGNFDDTVSAVNDAARGFKEIFEKIHNIAFEAGVAGFTKSAVVNYVPRLWRFDMIRRLATTSEGTEALTGLIEQAIAKNGRKVVIDGVEETFTGDVKAAAKVFTERLIRIAKSTENAPMTEQDQELVEALGDLLGPLKAKTGSRTPFGRARILLDESAEITTTGDLLGNGRNNLSLADLFDDDLPKVFRKYITSVMGAVNERRLINGFNDYLAANGFKGPKKVVDGVEVQEPLKVSTVNEMLDTARKLGGAVEDGHLEGLKEVIAALRYEPIYSGAPKFGDKAMSLFMQYGYLTTGGQFGLAAISEVARIVGTLGVRRTFTQLPVLAEMIANYKNLDRPSQNFASFLDAWFSPSTDRLRRTFMDPLGSAEYTGPFQNAMRGATNLMSDISGLAPINSFTQQLTAATALQHLFELGSGALKKGLDVGAIRSLGLEPDEYKKLAEWVASNAELKDGFLGKRVVGLKNMDAVEMDQLKKFVDRMVRTRIQDVPTRGDFHKMAFTWWGRLVTQFSTFNLKGIDNFLIQNAGRVKQGGGLQVAKEITATAMLAGLIGYGRNYADWWSFKQSRNYEEAKKREELLTLEGVVRGSFSGPSEMFLLTKGADAMWGLVDKDPLFAPYRYSGLSAFGFPGETTIRNAVGVINDAKGALIGKPLGLDVQRQITSKTVHMGRMLLPLQNMPGIKQYLNILETEISDEYNLNRRQPRSSD